MAKEAPQKSAKKAAPAPEKSGSKKSAAPAPAPASSKTSKEKGKGDTKQKKPTKCPFEVGQILVFDGYGEKVKNPAFNEGDFVKVLEIKAPDKFTAVRVAEGEDEDDAPADTCFVSEVHVPTDEEQAAIDAITGDGDEDADSPYTGDEEAEEEDEAEVADDDDEDEEEDEDADEESDDSEEEESEDADDSEEESDDEEADDEEEEEEKPAKSSKKASAPAKSGKDKSKDTGTKAKKAKKEEAEDEEESEEEESAIELTDSVKAIIEESGGDALEAVKAVKGRMNKDVVDMGVLLSHIHGNNIHASILTGTGKKAKPKYEADKKGFVAYVKDVLDLEARVAYGYMAVAKLAATFGIDSETVAKIGWTKLQQICDVANEGNIKGLLKAAKEMNREDLVKHLTEEYADKGDGSGKRKKSDDKTKKLSLKVDVFGDQASMVKTAIAAAKETIGKDDDGAALVHIIQEWSAMQDGGEESDESEDADEGDEEEEEAPKAPKKSEKSGKKKK